MKLRVLNFIEILVFNYFIGNYALKTSNDIELNILNTSSTLLEVSLELLNHEGDVNVTIEMKNSYFGDFLKDEYIVSLMKPYKTHLVVPCLRSNTEYTIKVIIGEYYRQEMYKTLSDVTSHSGYSEKCVVSSSLMNFTMEVYDGEKSNFDVNLHYEKPWEKVKLCGTPGQQTKANCPYSNTFTYQGFFIISTGNYYDFAILSHRPLSRPNEMTGIKVVPVSSNQIKVSWNSLNDSNLIRIQIQGSMASFVGRPTSLPHESIPMKSVSPSFSQTTIGNLSVGTKYQLSICIENRNAKTCSNRSVWTQDETPHNVRDLRIDHKGKHGIRLIWRPPDIYRGVINHYMLSVKETNACVIVSCNRCEHSNTEMINQYFQALSCEHDYRKSVDLFSDQIKAQAQDLDPYTTYNITVYAVNRAGMSSGVSIQGTTDEDVSDAVTNIRATMITNSSFTVEWSPPDTPKGIIRSYVILLNIGRSCEKSYIRKCRSCPEFSQLSDDSILRRVQECKTEQSGDDFHQNDRNFGITMSNLEPYTDYSVKIIPFNLAGEGKMTKTDIRTDEGVSGPPSNLKCKGSTASSINIEWGPPIKPNGIILGYSISYLKQGGAPHQRSTVKSDKSQLEIRDLEPCTQYNISVRAENKVGYGEKADCVGTTRAKKHDPPGSLDGQGINSTTILVKWGSVKTLCPISYRVEVKKVGENSIECRDTLAKTKMKCYNLQSERSYTFRVRSLVTFDRDTFEGDWSEWTSKYITTKPGRPVLKQYLDKMSEYFRPLLVGHSQLKISLPFEIFTEEVKIIHYSLVISSSSFNITMNTKSEDKWRKDHLHESTWKKTEAGTEGIFEIPIENDKLKDSYVVSTKKSDNIQWFTIGSVTNCEELSKHCNGPLKPNTKYQIGLRAYSNGGFTTSPLIEFQTPEKPSISTSVIVSIVAVILVVIISAAVVCKVRTNKKSVNMRKPLQRKNTKVESFSPNDIVLEEKTISILELEDLEPLSGAIPLSEFKTRIVELSNDDYYKEAFQLLNKHASQLQIKEGLTHNVAQEPQNSTKNRYRSIIPFDQTRVKLIENDGYINANFIHGYFHKQEFIATQGPMDSTIGDFWTMVYENECQLIVMLTNIKEGEKIKCVKYWPNKGQSEIYDSLDVTNVGEKTGNIVVLRKFAISKDNKQRHVFQIHFTRWPDHKEPEIDDFYRLMKIYEQKKKIDSKIPIVVHCSAGVGRTGTFIVISNLIAQMMKEEGKEIDINGAILNLRRCRKLMVQSSIQYLFVHEFMHYWLAKQGFISEEDVEEEIYYNFNAVRQSVLSYNEVM